MNLGPTELLIVVVAIVPYGLIVWGIIDAASRPGLVWERSGQSKALWVILQVLGLFFCIVGIVLTLVYFVAIRPQLLQPQGGMGPPAPGPPPPGPNPYPGDRY